MTPTEQLRRAVVLRVVTAIIALAFLLTGAGIALVVLAAVQGTDLERAVPSWLAGLIGATVGSVGTLLANSKGDRDTVTVEQPPGHPVPVTDGT